jgi:hypothetical protein
VFSPLLRLLELPIRDVLLGDTKIDKLLNPGARFRGDVLLGQFGVDLVILLPSITVIAERVMSLSILARTQTVSLLEIFDEVALVVHSDFDDDLLIRQKRRLQQLARLFDPKFFEITDRRHSCFSLEQMLEARVGKIDGRRHTADRQMPVQIAAHDLYYFNYSWIHTSTPGILINTKRLH